MTRRTSITFISILTLGACAKESAAPAPGSGKAGSGSATGGGSATGSGSATGGGSAAVDPAVAKAELAARIS